MPKRYISELFSQRGSVMVMALLIFLIISVLATSIISVAAMESKISLHDAREEEARQLADGGIQIARNVIMNYMGSSGDYFDEVKIMGVIQPKLGTIFDLDGKKIDVNIVQFSETSGIITIESTGTIKNPSGSDIKKTARAEILVNSLPNYPLRSNKLKVMGKYFSTVSSKEVLLNADGTLGLGMFNIQDWDKRALDKDYDPDVFNPLPLHGPTYNDPDFIDSNRSFFEAGNSNNSTNNYTWWVDYIYTTGPLTGNKYQDITESKLYVAPFWKPYGIVNILNKDNSPAEVGITNDWDNDSSGFSGLFDYRLTNPISVINYPLRILKSNLTTDRTYNPPEILKSTDFMGKFMQVDTKQNVSFEENQVNKYREIAQNSPDWQYISGDSTLLQLIGANRYRLIVDSPSLVSSKFFIDLSAADTVELDFTTCAHYNSPIFSWDPLNLNPLINSILNQSQTFFNTFRNRLDSIIAVSPASLYVGLDSFMFEGINGTEGKKPYIYLLSGQDIDLLIDPVRFNGLTRYWNNAGSIREIRTFILAGKDIRITSTPEQMTFKGIISASKNMTFFMDYFDEHENMVAPREVEKKIYIIKDPDIVSEFPEPWAYIGKGPIMSYKYID